MQAAARDGDCRKFGTVRKKRGENTQSATSKIHCRLGPVNELELVNPRTRLITDIIFIAVFLKCAPVPVFRDREP